MAGDGLALWFPEAALIYGLEHVKEQRKEIQEVRCHFEGYDAEQPSRTTQRLFPKRTSV
ncbi:hypothetical protein F2Q69_00015841 [Brassica cretica]|uniref:Uncharacterized protein n=1 Tax=Brassica cretica TaxID=69181 RepID=A0A8S9QYE8_BRACR|nr:hypothetical protein F2Q69_00015841 [Brassica cretica]